MRDQHNNIVELSTTISRLRPTVNRLTIRAEGTEDLTAFEINSGTINYLSLAARDRLGRDPEPTEVTIEDSIERIEITVDDAIPTEVESASIDTTLATVRENTENILNSSGILNRAIYYLVQLRDLPVMQRIMITGGVILVTIGGLYIAYKIITRPRVSHITWPFGTIRPFRVVRGFNWLGNTITVIGNTINLFMNERRSRLKTNYINS